jgi:NADPH2:quinone reductase
MAEFAAVPAQNLLPLPDHVSFEHAAAMPVAYTTAWRMLMTAANLRTGESVLVLGVGGGVGSAALTLAGRGVDVVVDPLGVTWPESIRSLARGGRMVVCGATAGNKPEFDIRELYQRHRRILGAPMGNWRDFTAVMRLLFSGEIQPVIDRVFPLSDAAGAHRRVESGESFGKVVLTA